MTENIDEIGSTIIELDENIERKIIDFLVQTFEKNKLRQKVTLSNFMTNTLIECLAIATAAGITSYSDEQRIIDTVVRILKHCIREKMELIDEQMKYMKGKH